MKPTGCLVFGLAVFSSLFTGAFGVTPTDEGKEYQCFVDICNVKGNADQFCDHAASEQRCRYCSEVQRDCWTVKMPLNCTRNCKEQSIQEEKEKGCGPLNQTSNGHHNGSNIEIQYGGVIRLQCDHGYHCDGTCLISCREFGHFSGFPKCAANQCSGFVKNRNLKYHPEKPKYVVGEKANFSCSDGLIIQGDASATCLADGLWSIKETPACINEETKDYVYMYFGAAVSCIVCFGFGFLFGYLLRKRKLCCNTRTDREYEKVHESEPHTDKQFHSKETQTAPFMTQSEADLINGRLKDDRAPYERQKSSSANAIYVAPAIPSGSPTPADSSDSGLGNGNTKENPIVNININNNFSPQNHLFNNNECRHAADKPEKSNEPNKSALGTETKVPNNDKLSTEESGEKADVCHGELQDDRSLSSANLENITTTRKQIVEHENQDQETITGFPDAQCHCQVKDAKDKPVMFTNGGTSINHDDILPRHVKKDQKQSQVCTQATESKCIIRKMALNQNQDNQDDILSKDQDKKKLHYHSQAREDNKKPGQYDITRGDR